MARGFAAALLAAFALVGACQDGRGDVHDPDASAPDEGGTAPDGGDLVDPEAELRALLGVPDHFATPHIPEHNPPTAEKITLGRRLFYDRQLSANGTQSCADCHHQGRGFAESLPTSVGSTGDVLTRNSPGLANVAYLSSYTWANDTLLTLEDQILVPLVNDAPVELGVTDGVRDEVLARFDDDATYAALFADAFPDSDSGANLTKVRHALASFMRTLISGDSAYDRYLAGDPDALTAQQKLGFSLFNGERFECHHCHSGTHFTVAYRDANTLAEDVPLRFFNDGLYNVDGTGGYPERDQGLFELTQNTRHKGLFRPPSLRNVAVTAPYMHDGSIARLREVVEHYVAGGRNLEDGPLAGDGRLSPLKSGLVRPFVATDEEIDAVVAFLESLTDERFLENPAFAAPEGGSRR